MNERSDTNDRSFAYKATLERNEDEVMLRSFFGREAGQASVEFLLIFTFSVIFLVGGLAVLAFASPVLLR